MQCRWWLVVTVCGCSMTMMVMNRQRHGTLHAVWVRQDGERFTGLACICSIRRAGGCELSSLMTPYHTRNTGRIACKHSQDHDPLPPQRSHLSVSPAAAGPSFVSQGTGLTPLKLSLIRAVRAASSGSAARPLTSSAPTTRTLVPTWGVNGGGGG